LARLQEEDAAAARPLIIAFDLTLSKRKTDLMKISQFALGCKLSIGVITVACLGAEAIAAPTSQPFRATLNISELVTPIGSGPCYLTGEIIVVNGLATHIGKVMVPSSPSLDCINPKGSSFTFYSKKPLILVAANGDQIWACYSGTLTQGSSVPPTKVSNIYLIDGTFNIVGGMGNFGGASGSGTLQGLEDLSGIFATPALGQIILNGTIAYGSPSGKNKPDCSA